MKLLRNIFINCLIYFLVIFTSASFVKAEDYADQFAFVFNSSRNTNPSEFSLYGSYPLNQKVNLLHINANKVCTAVTQKHEVFGDEMISFPITILRTLSKCEAPNQYSVAFFGKVSEYRIVSLKPVTDHKIINSLDRAIHNSQVLQSFNKASQVTIPYNKSFPLTYFKPKVFQFSISKQENYLISYEKNEKSAYGPKFVIFEKKPQILTGWCSYPYVHPFILNQELYFESGSYCCDCGITVMELFKIKANQVCFVHADGSESD